MHTIDRIFTALSGVALIALTALVVADVAFRYVANAPIVFAHDLVVLYLMPLVFFMGFGPTLHRDEHIAIDLFSRGFPPRLKALSRSFGGLVGLCVFVPLLWVSFERAYESFMANEVIASIVAWPAWASYAIVPLGTLAMVVACVARIFDARRRIDDAEDVL